MKVIYIVEGKYPEDTNWETQYVFENKQDAQTCKMYLNDTVLSMRFHVIPDIILTELPTHMKTWLDKHPSV